MFRLFIDSVQHFIVLTWRIICPGRGAKNLRSAKRMISMLFFLPIFGTLQLIHWFGFLLDELLFRGYRDVRINQPLFVVGTPRSGTTLLHRTLAQDEQFTTFSTWECLFALSITERKFWLTAIKIDRLIGSPFARIVTLLTRVFTTQLEGIHSVSLSSSEEDYLSFSPILSCFILVLPFPFEESIWRMGYFDRDVKVKYKKRIMAWYKTCLQKHLYVHGTDKRLLSKNASFASLLGSLDETFPDACYLCCMRDPLETLPSQLSAIRPGLKLFGVEKLEEYFRDRFIDLFRYYYNNLISIQVSIPDKRTKFVDMALLQNDLYMTVTEAYVHLGLPLSQQHRLVLKDLDLESKSYQSLNRYSLNDFGLDCTELESSFSQVYALYEFSRDSKLKRSRIRQNHHHL